MAVAQKAVPAIRSDAGQWIRESLAQLEAIGEPLDAWQSDVLARALAFLQTGNYALAMDAAFRVCRPKLYRTRAALIAFGGGPTVTIAEVRQELERVLADQAA